MKKYFLSALTVSFTVLTYAQAQQAITADRPDQTESPFITPKNYLQIETGFLFEKVNSEEKNFAHPTVLWKYGLNENFELRLETEFVTKQVAGENSSGLSPITVGFKAKLAEEKKIIPHISFLGHLTTNRLGSKEFYTTHLAPSFRFLFEHTISDRLALAYNLGAEWNGETPDATGIYTLATAYDITDKWGAFLEMYGYINEYARADHRIDAGVTYLVNNDFQLDVSAGAGLSEISPNHFFSVGFSYRFPLR